MSFYRDIKKAAIVWDSTVEAYRCTFPIVWKLQQHKDFIDVLKKAIPSGERDYNPKTYEWLIHEKWLDVVVLLTTQVFGSPYIAKKEEWSGFNIAASTNTNEKDLKDFDTILRTNAVITNGVDVAKISRDEAVRYYRKAAFLLHPDKNPANATQMSQLNEVFTRLKGTLYK